MRVRGAEGRIGAVFEGGRATVGGPNDDIGVAIA
jgi:hypothetical protein